MLDTKLNRSWRQASQKVRPPEQAQTHAHARTHTRTHARRDRLLDKPTQCFQSHLYDSHQESGQLLAALNHVLHQHQTENPDTNLRHLESARQSIGLSLALVRWRLTGMIQWDTGQTIHLQTIHKQSARVWFNGTLGKQFTYRQYINN